MLYDESYLTTGEFAKACGTTKDTLFHYEKLGLMTPAHIKENGYRCYAPRQIYQFGLIQTMQEADCSLKEIESYMGSQSPERYLVILEEKEKTLAEKMKKIRRMQRMLHEAKRITKEAMDATYDKPFLHTLPEEWLLVSPLAPYQGEKANLIALGQHYAYSRQHRISITWPSGCIISEKALREGHFDQPDFCFDKVERKQKDPRIQKKPEGQYLSIYHQGSYQTLPEAYALMMKYMQQEHLTLSGPSYEQELINYFAEPDTHRYVVRIDILVAGD